MSESWTLIWLRLTEWGLLVSGAVLVIGLIGEYRLPSWHWRLWFFELLVLIGCGGELLSDAGVFWSSEHLQQIEHSRVISLGELANEADEKARHAILDSGTAISKAVEANNTANGASATAGQANAKAETAQKRADAVEQESDDLGIKLGAVENKRASLEQSLTNLAICNAPRVLTNWYSDGKSWVDPLRRFSGYQGNIEFVADPEARRAALQIRSALHAAGWDVVINMARGDESIEDAVMIKSYFPFGSLKTASRIPSLDAAKAVVLFLHSYFWQASRMDEWSTENDVQPYGIKVEVGLYPAATYELPPGMPKEDEQPCHPLSALIVHP